MNCAIFWQWLFLCSDCRDTAVTAQMQLRSVRMLKKIPILSNVPKSRSQAMEDQHSHPYFAEDKVPYGLDHPSHD